MRPKRILMNLVLRKKSVISEPAGKEIIYLNVCLDAPNDSNLVILLSCIHVHIYIC